ELRVAHQRAHDPLLCRLERIEPGCVAELLQVEVERPALAEAHRERDDLRLDLVVAPAELVAILDTLEVTDRAPRSAEPLRELLDRTDRGIPCRRGPALQTHEVRRELAEQRAHAGHDVLRTDVIELRETLLVEQGIGARWGRAHPRTANTRTPTSPVERPRSRRGGCDDAKTPSARSAQIF